MVLHKSIRNQLRALLYYISIFSYLSWNYILFWIFIRYLYFNLNWSIERLLSRNWSWIFWSENELILRFDFKLYFRIAKCQIHIFVIEISCEKLELNINIICACVKYIEAIRWKIDLSRSISWQNSNLIPSYPIRIVSWILADSMCTCDSVTCWCQAWSTGSI